MTGGFHLKSAGKLSNQWGPPHSQKAALSALFIDPRVSSENRQQYTIRSSPRVLFYIGRLAGIDNFGLSPR